MTEKAFRIEFSDCSQTDGGTPIFSADQRVQAWVVLRLEQPMRARTIKVYIIGNASVHWKQADSHRSSDAIYLAEKKVLWASPDQQIPSGEHRFPFTFTIPAHCPANIEYKHGHIRYSCIATIDRPWKWRKKVKQPFVVFQYVNLGTIYGAYEPVEKHIDRNIGIFFFKDFRYGKLTAKVSVPQSGFIPGERIPFSVEIQNGTSKNMTNARAKLLQIVSFYGCSSLLEYDLRYSNNHEYAERNRNIHHKSSSRRICQVETGIVVAPQSSGAFHANLAIPYCVPTSKACPNINISYEMKVILETNAMWGGSASVKFPIIIGTVPICR